MQTYYTKWYSPSVGREMEIKVYGHAGRPVLFIPCQDGRFFDFENYRMTDAWAPWIESGQCMVFSIDTLDKETYSATYDPHDRIRRHEAWMNYIVREVAPFIQSMTNDRNGWDGTPGIIAFGCSLGATHAANSPVDYLAGISPDHPFIRLYNDHKAVVVVGQGAWEVPESTFRLRDICAQKDIHVWFDIWGYDVKHDWDWWYQQVAYHVPHIL